MLNRTFLVGIGMACLAMASAFALGEGEGPATAMAASAPNPVGPPIALIATKVGAEHSSLYVVQAGSTEPLAPVATFSHLQDAAVRAAVVPGTSMVLATADTLASRDASFNASLFRLVPHTPPTVLVDQVVHASRPLLTRARRAFVSRGIAGPAVEGQMRIDHLTIEEVNLATGQTEVVHAQDGYLLFLAGETGREILLYRILPDHADLVAVDPDTRALRPILKQIPPFARDFSVSADGNTLVYQNRDEQDPTIWVVDRVDLASLHTQRLYSGPSMSLAPAILPLGSVLYNPPGRGLTALDAKLPVHSPLGAGVDFITASTADERFLFALHTRPSELPTPFVVDTKEGRATLLPTPPNSQIALAGIMPQTEGGAQ